MSERHLTATYNSPDTTKVFSAKLPPLPSDTDAQTVKDKTGYLNALRTNVGQMQADVNAFLTKRMEDEKASATGKGNEKKQAREQKEEEMYGEEDPEEDG